MVKYKNKEIPEELLNQIFDLRVKINQVFYEKGPANIEFIKLSQDLEEILNRFQVKDSSNHFENDHLQLNNLVAYELVQKIEMLRKELISSGLNKGLQHESTIQISQQLDIYITKFQKLNIKKDN